MITCLDVFETELKVISVDLFENNKEHKSDCQNNLENIGRKADDETNSNNMVA